MINFSMIYVQLISKSEDDDIDENEYIFKNITFNECESEDLKTYQNRGMSMFLILFTLDLF